MRGQFASFTVATLLWGLASAPGAYGGEPIVGKWRAPGGGIVQVSACGADFCATVIKGDHKGKSVGRMSGSGHSYQGTVTDPREDKTYDGTASIQDGGNALKLEGCAFKVFCKVQTWTRG